MSGHTNHQDGFDYSSMLQGAQKRLSAVYSRNDIHKFCHLLLQAMRCRFQKVVRFGLVSKGLVQREAFLKIADRQILLAVTIGEFAKPLYHDPKMLEEKLSSLKHNNLLMSEGR